MDLKSDIQEAKEKVVHVFDTDKARSGEADILDTLKKEHDEVRGLLSNLEDSESPAERHALVQKIAAALVPHTVAEEKIVYKMVIALADQQAQVDGYEGTLEHKWAAKTLEKLGAIKDANSSEHKATAKVLKELVEHHIREEEGNIWRDVRKHCSHDDRARLDSEYQAAKRRVKLPEIA